MKILNIVTKPDALALQTIDRERENAANEVTVVDLTIAEPDYRQLLEKIFEADSVHVW